MRDHVYTKRRFLKLVGACAALFTVQCSANPLTSKQESNKLDDCKFSLDPSLKALAQAAPFVKVKEKWTAEHLYEFLNALPNESLLSVEKGLGLVKDDAGLDALQGKSKDVRNIQKQALWVSSNILAYPFRDETVLNYHSLVKWIAEQSGVASELVASESTFDLEREVQKQLFAKIWDKLDKQQRKELLDKINRCSSKTGISGDIIDIAKIVSLTGAGAIATLSATVAFTGFTFYTTMSVTISTVAGFFGITLPFAAYAGASSIVAFLSGPVGWAIAGIAALGGIALSGRADMDKTTAFVCQIHSLKATALIEAGIPEKAVFGE